MQTVMVNWLAVLVAAIVAIVIGSLWYGPVFGKTWMKLMGWDPNMVITPEMKKGMWKKYLAQFVASFVTNWVLVYIITFASAYGNMTGASVGLASAFWVWLGFIGVQSIGMVLWEGKSWKLWAFNNAATLVTLLVNGAILAVWM